jgi:hypothetical protein
MDQRMDSAAVSGKRQNGFPGPDRESRFVIVNVLKESSRVNHAA